MNAEIAKLSGLDGDPLEKTPVEYEVTGKPNYDEFFKDAAHLRASLVVADALTTALTQNVKKVAISHVAGNTVDRSVAEILGGTDPKDMTLDQAVAVAKLESAQHKLAADEREFLVKSGANAAQFGLYMTHAATSTATMIQTGQTLSGKVKDDFSGLEARKVPAVTSALTTSVQNLNEATTKLPSIAKQFTRLGQALSTL